MINLPKIAGKSKNGINGVNTKARMIRPHGSHDRFVTGNAKRFVEFARKVASHTVRASNPANSVTFIAAGCSTPAATLSDTHRPVRASRARQP